MAYMIGKRGPYSNKAGEWSQNVFKKDAWWYHQRLRIGKPRSYHGTLSVARLKEHGMVGLYEIIDQPIPRGGVAVPTPPELMEPPE